MIALALLSAIQIQELSTWPWPGAMKESPRPGITRWFAKSGSNQTEAELFEFDFKRNPRLRLQIFDQDAVDAEPFDNRATGYYRRGLGDVVQMVNGAGKGRVAAAWNGSFFGYDGGLGSDGSVAFHIGMVVLDGKLRYNVGSPRWTFGVKQTASGPRFFTLHVPTKRALDGKATFACSGVQCLIEKGQALAITNPPGNGSESPARSENPIDAGPIPEIDALHTSRTSMAWPKDSSRLWLLVVNEPDHETNSKRAARQGLVDLGGFNLKDVQRFWTSRAAWGAVNLDGGSMAQDVYQRHDGKYEMLPPRICSPNKRLVFGSDFENAPPGGALMYFYVIETGRLARRGRL